MAEKAMIYLKVVKNLIFCEEVKAMTYFTVDKGQITSSATKAMTD